MGYTQLFNLGLAGYLHLSGVDYKTQTRLLLLRVPQQFMQGCKPSRSGLVSDTTPASNSEKPPTVYKRKPQLLLPYPQLNLRTRPL
jgi:hypothetical protein